MRLFELSAKTRLAEIDKEWISTIKEFKEILVRDKGSKGDSQGRLKLQATKEFTFLYHYCDYRSKFINYSEKDKLKACLVNAEMPDNYELDKDQVMLNAIEVYKILQETPTLKALNELREVVHTSHRAVRKLRETLENLLENLDVSELQEEEEDGRGRKLRIDPVTKITNLLDSVMRIANKLPETQETIDKLEKQVKIEMSDEAGIRGGYEKGVREDKSSTRHFDPSKLMN